MTVIPAVVPADPAPAPAEASSPPAKPGFDHALAKASHKDKAKSNSKAPSRPDAKPRAKDGNTASAKGKAEIGDNTDAAPPTEVATLGDATAAALTGNVAPTAVAADAPASDTNPNATDTAPTQPGITNVFAAAVAALTAAETTPTAPTQGEPASQMVVTDTSGTQVGEKSGAERKDFVQTVPGANGADTGRAIDLPPVLASGDDANANGNGAAHQFTRTTVPAAANASATAVAHAADPAPVHGTAPAALTRNNESQASTGEPPSLAAAPVSTTARVDAPVATTETTATTPAPPPPPAEQLVAVMRPLQRTADGTYRIRIELRPPELGRVDMRVEVKDGVVHASIHAEHAETAELVRNALDDLRARLDADGVRAGSLEVNDGRANDTGRDSRRHQDSVDEPELVTAPTLMTTRPAYQSDALLDVRI